MFDRLIRILSGAEDQNPGEPDPARIAIAAVLVEAARVDNEYIDVERSMIDRILAERFELSEEEATALRKIGEKAQAGSSDLVRFTRVLKDNIPLEERTAVIEAVWRVIYSDGNRDALQDNLVRRLCGLLYVPDKEAGMIRHKLLAGP